MWVIIEHALSIICANAPTFRPIMGILRRWMGSFSKSNGQPGILVGRRVPNWKEGLVTIGGTSASSSSNGTGKRPAGWQSTLTQETLVGEENTDEELLPAPAVIQRPSIHRTARRNSLTAKRIINNTHPGKHEDADSNTQINPPPTIWPPTATEYRVTINSGHQRPTTVPVADATAIAVRTETKVAWGDALQRGSHGYSDSDRIGVGL